MLQAAPGYCGRARSPYHGRVGSWDSRRSEEFLRDVVREMEVGLGNKPARRKHLTAASCLYISGFWRLSPMTPSGIRPWTALGLIGDFRPRLCVLTHTSESGYATGVIE